MPGSRKRPSAVVVLPAGVNAAALRPGERRWLAKGRVRRTGRVHEPLQRLLGVLGRPAPREGMAALRKWGQTGERPDSWLCAADPVYLEARLDHLCLFALQDLAEGELASLIETLQAELATDRAYAFSSVGGCGYLEGAEPMATAAVSALEAHGELPDRFLPEGREAVGHDRLQGELQMCLHEHALNREREAAGRLPVNALWFWGGGRASAALAGLADEEPLPMLFSDDPLATGYWRAAGGRRAAWPGSFAGCAEASDGAFVAVAPRVDDGEYGLEVLRKLLADGSLGRLTLLLCDDDGDGLRIDLDRHARLRFWRRALAVPGGEGRS